MSPSCPPGPLPELRQQILDLVDRYAQVQGRAAKFRPGLTAIPPSGKVIGAGEMRNMVEAALDGWLTTGRFNDAFEARLGQILGVPHVRTVNSGSSANLVAFQTLTAPELGDRAICPGDEVITVAAGFPTTVNPALHFGATVVFVDVELGTYNINAGLLEAEITPRTKAIMLAHTLGNPFNLEVVTQLCKKYGLWLIEDCCDALGSTYQGQIVGTFGDIGTLSFYPAHHITMGEGGAVFTRSAELARIAESIRDWGRDCYCPPGRDNTCGKRFCWKLGQLPQGYDHKYTYSHLGFNLKITDMQAACGLAQLDRLPDFIATRKRHFAYLSDRLQGCLDQLILPRATPHADPSWFGFPITLRPEAVVGRAELVAYLDQNKVGTRLLFGGNLVRQPYMRGRNHRIGASGLTQTDEVMNQTFWIGVHPALTEPMLDHAAHCIASFLGTEFAG